MPFGIPREDFHGGFGLPEVRDIEQEQEQKTDEVTELTMLLIKAGVTWAPRQKAEFLLANGVRLERRE